MTTPMISLELTTGGYYTGTHHQSLTFLSQHRDLVKDQQAIDVHFHWSDTKGEYVLVCDMHPTYIRNALRMELHTLPHHSGKDLMEDILGDDTLDHELVGDMYRLWCEMFDVPWNDHRDALLEELVNSAIDEMLLECGGTNA